ncbi:AAA family ATPase [Pararhodonellum marinum]|uniref:AAA family ATPase n=1 Tax=Pararhodonellum marinum TaxID=2755358 RepID=UPI0018903B7F|nr:SMC family ATPase [Pararhodonellum marinum]
MIPVKLEIQGLYSYKEMQVINFEQLTAAGLFGIFGAVGSGKSSILEAILLALYGSTERLSDRGEKNSMLNLQSDQVLINLEFKAGKNNAKTYLARYSAKRNSKNFEEIRPAEHTFYEITPEGLLPLTEGAETIVGMKKDHFKQTVIIPQGKFREFVDLTPGPRADMMKELFGLERFDLAGKTGSLLRAVKDDKIRLETHLQQLQEFSKEALEEKTAMIKETSLQVEKEENRYQNTEANCKKLEQLKQKHDQLINFQKEWKALENRQEEIEEKKAIWKDFLKAKTYLKPVWEQIKEKEIDLEKFRVSVVDCTRFKVQYQEQVQKLEEEEAVLKEKAEQRPARETKIRDLKQVLEIQRHLKQVEKETQRAATLRPDIEKKRVTQKTLWEKIKQSENLLESFQIPDLQELNEVKNAALQWDQFVVQEKEIRSELTELETQKQVLDGSLNRLRSSLPSGESFETWIYNLKEKLQQLENEKDLLLQKKGLAAHAHVLVEGVPCPLCGSDTHPFPLSPEASEGEWTAMTDEISRVKTDLEKANQTSQEIASQNIYLKHTDDLRIQKQQTLDQLNQKLADLAKSMEKKQLFGKAALVDFVGTAEKTYSDKEKLVKEVKQLRVKWEQGNEALEKENEELTAIDQQLINLQTTIATRKEAIKDPVFCQAFYDKSPDNIEATIQKVLEDIKETAFKLEGKQRALKELREKQATNLANLRHFEASTTSTEKKLTELRATYQALMQEHGFQHEQDLIDLFGHSLDADKVDAEIRQYEDRRLIVASKITELESEPGVTGFDTSEFDQQKLALAEIKTELESIKKTFMLLDQQIIEGRAKLKEKQQVLEKFHLLENRETDLKELEKLFKGSGFVKYVSSIYLKELCATANLRFSKLTKNSLSLEIDDNNTFWVVDYLNGGKRRLLKTLSGGQTFQASLCLALALAEKVKFLNQADQSFFFLDEGFGALDRNSLRVVFETLKSLRHENRIVGIISHVEELQQEIEVYAKVEMDPERGSQVGYSF